MNNMEKIAELLDVKFGEEFHIIEDGVLKEDLTYKFSKSVGLIVDDIETDNNTLVALLTGELKLHKIPWKPLTGDRVFAISPRGESKSFIFNTNDISLQSLYIQGWLFRTEEDADTNKVKILQEYKTKLIPDDNIYVNNDSTVEW